MTSPQCEHVVGLDGLAIIVNKSNAVSALSKAQLASIFTGEIADWRELGGAAGPIKVLSRDDKSGTYDTFKALVLGKGKLAAGAVRIEDSRELSDRVAATRTRSASSDCPIYAARRPSRFRSRESLLWCPIA
jgi:phosphate transport system substrate-binding protein